MLDVLWQISDNPHRMSKLKTYILLILITATYSSRSLYAYQAPANNNEVPAKAPEARGILRQAKAAARRIENQLQRDPLIDQIGAAEASAGDLQAAINCQPDELPGYQNASRNRRAARCCKRLKQGPDT